MAIRILTSDKVLTADIMEFAKTLGENSMAYFGVLKKGDKLDLLTSNKVVNESTTYLVRDIGIVDARAYFEGIKG